MSTSQESGRFKTIDRTPNLSIGEKQFIKTAKGYAVKCGILGETQAAMLLQKSSHEKEWFPLSTIDEIHRTFDTLGFDTVVCATWILERKGWIK